jgi:hypothetical protein
MTGPLAVGTLTQVFGIRTGFVVCGLAALVSVLPMMRARTVQAR